MAHSPESCLWTDHNFRVQLLKNVTNKHFCEIISKSDQGSEKTNKSEFLHVRIVQVAPIHQSHV